MRTPKQIDAHGIRTLCSCHEMFMRISKATYALVLVGVYKKNRSEECDRAIMKHMQAFAYNISISFKGILN